MYNTIVIIRHEKDTFPENKVIERSKRTKRSVHNCKLLITYVDILP